MRPATLLTTIVTPATNTALTTLANVKSDIKITTGSADDTFLTRQIGVASTAIQNYCNRMFAVQGLQDEFWFARDSWPTIVRDEVAPLQLSVLPPPKAMNEWSLQVASVVETIAGVATTLTVGTDYLVDPTKAQLTRLNQFGNPRHWHGSPVTVAYSGGFGSIPLDVEEAAILLVKLRWYGRIRDPMVREENIEGAYQAQYWFATGPGGAGDMPPDVMAMVDRYRVPVIG